MRESYTIGTTVFNNWIIVRKIGEGSFGVVYEIERKDFGQVYKAALKVVTIPQNQAEILEKGMNYEMAEKYYYTVVEDVVNEFALMARLKGTANVVSYEDHIVIKHENAIGWDILIKMELLTSLQYYPYTNPLKRRDIIKLGIDICKGLELCQKYNIIHRDIKPDNIFVSDNGDFKLGDFGIARTVEKTMSGLSKKGTYNFMAPEVFKGEAYGHSVDLYSLGIVMYKLLNKNRQPFLPAAPNPITHSDEEKARTLRFCGEKFPPAHYAQGRLNEIILKAAAYKPENRYSSPIQMRMELEAILYDEKDESIIYPDGEQLSFAQNVYVTNTSQTNGGTNINKPINEVDEKTASVFGSLGTVTQNSEIEKTNMGINFNIAENASINMPVNDDPTEKTQSVFSQNLNKIIFADPVFEDIMRRLIKKEHEDIHDTDFDKIATLHLTYEKTKNNIKSLDDLKYFKNLEEFTFNNSDVSDISPISQLTKLRSLELISNKINDVSALSNLTNLARLRLDKNNISDISALKNLTNLRVLFLDENNIADIYALSLMKNMERLSLHTNKIHNISPLLQLTELTQLNIANNQICDIGSLAGMLKLEKLYMSINKIVDISVLVNLKMLDHLEFMQNPINDLSILSNLNIQKIVGDTIRQDNANASSSTNSSNSSSDTRATNDNMPKQQNNAFSSQNKLKPSAILVSGKNYTTVKMLAYTLGFLGMHRFYVGKVGTGLGYIMFFAFLVSCLFFMPLLGLAYLVVILVLLLVDIGYINKEIFLDCNNLPVCKQTADSRVYNNSLISSNKLMIIPISKVGMKNLNKSYKNKWVALFLSVLLGIFGAHRFYVGKKVTGIVWMFSFGLGFIGYFVDIFNIMCNSFTDKYEHIVTSSKLPIFRIMTFDKKFQPSTTSPLINECNDNFELYVLKSVQNQ